MRKKLILFVLFLSVPFAVHAQKLTVESMAMAINDISARTTETKRYDGNREACGLIKVQLPLQGVTFEGTVIGEVANKSGEYWVYMNDGARQLCIKHPDYYPLEIYFSNYGIRKIDSLTTYILVIGIETIAQQQPFSVQSLTTAIETFTVNGVSFNMVRVEGGTFMRGSTSEHDERWEKYVHEVTLPTYYIGETEVTQALWKAVMDSNPSEYQESDRPVESVSWVDCQEFVKKLNRMTAKMFRLPTVNEWEYAARGGQKSHGYKYSGGETVDDVAWYCDNSGNTTHIVKTKQPNELGLYDMSGNVREWCDEWLDFDSGDSQTASTVYESADKRIYRGGCWGDKARYCVVQGAWQDSLLLKDSGIGFRLAL